jgi:short-subunit dehydrogenase
MTEGRKFAVVTGASSGIGLELARQFAGHDYDVLITAEDQELAAAATELSGRVQIKALQADLAEPQGVQDLVRAVAGAGRPVDALAINAGIGNGGVFLDIPLADEERLLALNIGSTVAIAKRLLPDMARRGSGRVLFTASVASTMPGPYYATYAASKAFVLSFAQALRHELKDTGVSVTALMPGPTDTEFFGRAAMEDAPADSADKDDPADVARQGYEALIAGKDHVVAGSMKNKLQAAGAKVMSGPQDAAAHARMTKPEGDAK